MFEFETFFSKHFNGVRSAVNTLAPGGLPDRGFALNQIRELRSQIPTHYFPHAMRGHNIFFTHAAAPIIGQGYLAPVWRCVSE